MRIRKIPAALMIVFVFVTSCLSVFAGETESETGRNRVFVTLSQFGQIVTNYENEKMQLLSLDWDSEESLNLADLFLKLHEEYCENGADGFAFGENEYGAYVKKLWNDESGNFGYQVNGGEETVLNLSYELKNDDVVDVCIYENTYPLTEVYTRFDSYFEDTAVNEELEIRLSEAGFDENWNIVFSPCEGAVILIDGEITDVQTDSDGKACVTFEEAGEYYISAVKQTEKNTTAITTPICKVTVSENEGETLNETIDETIIDELIENIIEKYCGDTITKDENMPWFYADLGLYYDLNPNIKRNEKRDEACAKLLTEVAEKSTVPSELAKIIIALRANHYDVKTSISGQLISYVKEKDERVTQPYTLPYILIALQDDLEEEQLDYLLTEATDSKEYWQDTEYGTDGISPMMLALSPYTDEPSVRELIDDSVLKIKECQTPDGYINSFGPAASTGLAIAGLSAIGMDALEIKSENKNLLDGLLSFVTDDNDGFWPAENSFSSEQGLRGLLAYKAFLNGEKIYDFSNENLKPIPKEKKPSDATSNVSGNTTGTPVKIAPVVAGQENDTTQKTYEGFEKEKANAQETVKFSDVDSSDWFYDAVCFVSKNGIMEGYENKFSPDEKLSRAMLVTILYRLEGCPQTVWENKFSDVNPDAWYYDAVNFANEHGIVYGVSESEFAPDEVITREQLATILKRYMEYKTSKKIVSRFDISGFADYDAISDYAKDSMAWAVESGLLVGTSADTLSPLDGTTRAETATILQRFSEKD